MKRITTILAAAVLVSTAACGGDSSSSTGPQNTNPAGTYALLNVNKKAIPTVVFKGPFRFPNGVTINPMTITVTGGELILDEYGQIHAAVDYRMEGPQGGVSGTISRDGDYEIRGGNINIVSDEGTASGSYRGGVITLGMDIVGQGDLRNYSFRYVP